MQLSYIEFSKAGDPTNGLVWHSCSVDCQVIAFTCHQEIRPNPSVHSDCWRYWIWNHPSVLNFWGPLTRHQQVPGQARGEVALLSLGEPPRRTAPRAAASSPAARDVENPKPKPSLLQLLPCELWVQHLWLNRKCRWFHTPKKLPSNSWWICFPSWSPRGDAKKRHGNYGTWDAKRAPGDGFRCFLCWWNCSGFSWLQKCDFSKSINQVICWTNTSKKE